jgi:hypothetical protein
MPLGPLALPCDAFVARASSFLSRLRTGLRLGAVWVREPDERESVGFRVMLKLGRVLCPRYVLTDPDKAWYDDREFFGTFYAHEDHPLPADRRFALRELLRLVARVPGDTAECGVYKGASSWFICDGLRRTHHGFDSFEGLSAPTGADGAYWQGGDLRASEATVAELLAPFDARLYRGWIPERFDEVADRRFSFVHVDVDLYEPTRDSFAFFYPRLAPGGILLCDDYGFTTCPGARRAVDEFMVDKPEAVVHLPTGQGLVVKAAD